MGWSHDKGLRKGKGARYDYILILKKVKSLKKLFGEHHNSHHPQWEKLSTPPVNNKALTRDPPPPLECDGLECLEQEHSQIQIRVTVREHLSPTQLTLVRDAK